MSAQIAIRWSAPAPHKAPSASALVALAIALVAALVVADARVAGVVPAAPSAQSPVSGIFTGTYADGLPVYRLPPVEVIARR